MKSIPFARADVAVVAGVDVVVMGGSCAGVTAAEALAHAGRHVALVEPRTYLGHELSATLRPWLPAAPDLLAQAPLLQAFLASQGTQAAGDEIPFSLHALKLFLEDRLLAAGVEIFYASAPVGVAENGAIKGIVIANKSGRQLLACDTWLDMATEQSEGDVFARTLEFDGVATPDTSVLEVPSTLGMLGNRVWLHRGYRGAEHLFVECLMRLAPGNSPEVAATHEGTARRLTTRLAAHLMQRESLFEGATFAAASHELYGPLPVESESSRPAPAALDPLNACAAALNLAEEVLQKPAQNHTSEPAGTTKRLHQKSGSSPAGSSLVVREPHSPQSGKRMHHAPGAPAELPVLDEVDVLVVGGGASGATAALVARRAGMRTALVDMNPGLGGTGTYGGVHSYWFGRRVGFAAQVTELTTKMHHRLRQPPPEGAVPRWNIEAKAQALREAVEDAGVRLYLNALVFGAVVDEAPLSENGVDAADPSHHTTVRGVAVATRKGPAAILARAVIDATGDGDVAAFAGAGVTYGAARDHVVMWYSLAQFARPGRTRNNFTSMVDVSNVRDYTRAIISGRRRLRDRDHDHGIYVAPRESRHITGEVQLTLSDQLLQRRWPDVVNIAFSNHDVKGHSASDWVQIGLIPPNLEVEIPYRAMLPQGLAGILVVGKAISGTHDALPAIRMQADMENLGGAAALAAAHACRQGCDLRDVDIVTIQDQLVEAGVLPAEVRTRHLAPWRLDGEALAQAIAALDERPLVSYADMEMDEVYRGRILPVDVCCAGPHVVPLLEAALAQTEDAEDEQGRQRRLLLAQLLCLLGSRAGVPVLQEALQEALAGDELPVRSSHIRYAGAPPDQGAMPQEVYWLHALARAADRRVLPLWQRVVDLLADATVEDVSSGVKGVFYYVEAVSTGAERLGAAEAAPMLRQLHSYAPFRDLVCRKGFQVDFFEERRAYLELLIARALARCGDVSGAAILVGYLDDVRALMAAHAHSELVAINGQDLGRDAAPWAQWLEAQGEALAPKPYRKESAPMRMWSRQILVAQPLEEAIAHDR